jgi:putative flippase GtrA
MLAKTYQRVIQELAARLPKAVYDFVFKYRRIVKYIISGGTAAFTDFLALYFLTDILKVWYLLSAALAFLVAFVVSFTLQKFWTFRGGAEQNPYKQLALFLSVSLFGNLVINTALMYLLVDFFKIWYMAAQFMAAIMVALLNFFVYKKLIFKVQ